MDKIDEKYCPMCGRTLKQTFRQTYLVKTSCACGYRWNGKPTFGEADAFFERRRTVDNSNQFRYLYDDERI